MQTQEATLRPQASIACLALEDNAISSPNRLPNVQIGQLPLHTKRFRKSDRHHSICRWPSHWWGSSRRNQQGQIRPFRQVRDDGHERAPLLPWYRGNSDSSWHYDLPKALHLQLLYKFRMTECESVANPLDQNLKLDANSSTIECEPTHIRQLVGSLIYLTITWPDLSYPVDLLSQFMQTPWDIHLDCVKRVLRYVSGTMNYGILYDT